MNRAGDNGTRTTTTARTLLITLLEGFTSAIVERGVFFFAADVMGFSDRANLMLAVCFGGMYVVGAVTSHRLAMLTGERRLLTAAIAGRVAVLAALMILPRPGMLFVANTLLGFLSGVKWPVLESYVGAGRGPADAWRALGRFSVTWALGMPIGMSAGGWLLSIHPLALLAAGCVLHGVNTLFVIRLPAAPLYLEDNHPLRPSEGEMERQRALVACSRWLMLMSYMGLLIIAPLAPGIFARLGFGTVRATALAAVVDWSRLGVFLLIPFAVRWQSRPGPLIASMLAIPAGFFMVTLGGNLALVLAGQVLCGLAAGIVYCSALYHAMVVKNAAVEAGGGHEGFIGTALLVGPLAGLGGNWLGVLLGSPAAGMGLGVGPCFAICCVGAMHALRAAMRQSRGRAPGSEVGR